MTAVDTSLPPALFDIEQPDTELAPQIRRRPGHAIRVHQASPTGQLVYCTCGEHTPARLANDIDGRTKWVYTHLGIAYDSAIDTALREAS